MRFKILALFALSLLMIQSCDKGEMEVKVKEGGLIEVKNPSMNYVVGNQGPYTSSLRVFQGEVKTTGLEIYKTFYSTRPDTLIETVVEEDTTIYDTSIIVTKLTSNTVLFQTLSFDDSQNTIENYTFTFDQLTADLTIEVEETPAVETENEYVIIKGYSANDIGQGLPAADGDYTIGDYWEFEYHATTSDGRTVVENKTTKATVATRYAGKYKCLEAEYYRIGVLTYTGADWPSETIIESVDAKTYRVLEYFGAFNGNEWYFQIVDGKISYPLTKPDGTPQEGNGQPLITCELNQGDMMVNLCGLPGANTVINDDVNGKDQLNMVFGYLTAGSGPREFYQLMEKIVD